MSNRENFLALVSEKESNIGTRNKERIKNRARLKESQNIALKVLNKLDDLGWTQKRLAEELNVTPQQVSKIVKGKENLTLETQVKLQEVLNIPILASFYENNVDRLVDLLTVRFKTEAEVQNQNIDSQVNTVSYKIHYNKLDKQYTTYPLAS